MREYTYLPKNGFILSNWKYLSIPKPKLYYLGRGYEA